MIQELVDRFMERKPVIKEYFSQKHPSDYAEIVRVVIEQFDDVYEYHCPDPERIHEIDDGGYQGTLLFVIGVNGYQPSKYWYVPVSYGSCSGCDTLEGIRNYSSNSPTEEQVGAYMTLALHIVQKMRVIDNYSGEYSDYMV